MTIIPGNRNRFGKTKLFTIPVGSWVLQIRCSKCNITCCFIQVWILVSRAEGAYQLRLLRTKYDVRPQDWWREKRTNSFIKKELYSISQHARFLRSGIPSPTHSPKIEDYPLSAIRNCLFNIFGATIKVWRPSPPSATWGRTMPRWQWTHLPMEIGHEIWYLER